MLGCQATGRQATTETSSAQQASACLLPEAALALKELCSQIPLVFAVGAFVAIGGAGYRAAV